MIEYIGGTVHKLTPTYAIIDNAGIGYCIHISVYTCEQLKQNSKATLLVHEIIREDAHELYGFFDETERAMFRMLLSVSGVGANTARVILSKLSSNEVATAIALGNVQILQAVKGIGGKTAQRIIVDLKDKVTSIANGNQFFDSQGNTLAQEALSALLMLGFAKNSVEKIVQSIVAEQPSVSVEDIVKIALKRL
ncbi:MAG TPA: Holliday junction branch migration protein RuvA [Bacteroidales bacterium]|nr:MAG: Holliday junction ATP-dependent DNA helicase RuvA [Bacteroidetes bacterium ADurb.Bin217]HOS83927.1 Holliday junction branch migration protein RuvA [Bacteroidales bacterium]HPH16304.1 Holliday junction branch migration protein RuvA [Bacteroidales bacterium]HPM12406.1 Holliday junction branch migration protein RuvA [Bacteroidales bacterium]